MIVRTPGRRRRAGAAAVEMAMVTPLFVLLILGTIEASRLGMVAQMLNVAAREACRTAVLDGATAAEVQSRVDTITGAAGIDVGTVTPTAAGYSDWTQAPSGSPITVTLAVPYAQVSWVGDPFNIGWGTVTASATMSSERDL